MRQRGSDGKFTKAQSPTTSGKAVIEHAGGVAAGVFSGIDPSLLAESFRIARAGVARVVRLGAGTVQVWVQSQETGVGERLAEALQRAGVAVELRTAP